MTSITLPKVLLLLFIPFMITSASATEQYHLREDYPAPNLPYACLATEILTASPCCFPVPHCENNINCPGWGHSLIASTATRLLGTIDIILEGDNHNGVQGLADLITRRNYITSTLVTDLGLGEVVEKLPEIDIHSIVIGSRSVPITQFVLLSIRTGINDSVLRDKIFEVVPAQNMEGSAVVLPNLVVGLNLLNDAGALAINPAIFAETGGD